MYDYNDRYLKIQGRTAAFYSMIKGSKGIIVLSKKNKGEKYD